MNVRDEGCGMEFAEEHATASLEFQDEAYYLCAERCRAVFQQHPHGYLPVRAGGGGQREHQLGPSE